MVNPLRKLNPNLSKLVAQLVYAKHQRQAEGEVAELRAELAALIRSGRTPEELCKALLAADPDRLTIAKQNRPL